MTSLIWLHLIVQCTPLGGLLANQHWALIHEGLHGRLPAWQAHLLCALFGAPMHALQHYHARHHTENRTIERCDEYPAWIYWPSLLGGLYVAEVLLCLTRWYGPLILLLQAGLIWVWGWWYVAALVVRALLISLSDYAYHYGGEGDIRQGYDLDAGALGNAYLLGFNRHGAHHRQPWLPCNTLQVERYDGQWLPAVLRQFKGPRPGRFV